MTSPAAGSWSNKLLMPRSGRLIQRKACDFAPLTPKAQVVRRVPVEAEVEDEDGVTVHVLLHVLEGALAELEVFHEDLKQLRRPLDVQRDPRLELLSVVVRAPDATDHYRCCRTAALRPLGHRANADGRQR